MMYKTHVKVGQTLYMLSLPLMSQAGLMPSIAQGELSTMTTSAITLGVSAVVGFHGATWGSGFPDIDHPTSTPAKRNPVLSSIFKAFKVKHRGRYSHSVDMVTLTFVAVMILVRALMGNIGGIAETFGNIASVWLLAAYIGAIAHLFADSLTKQGVRVLFFMPHVKLVLTKLNTSILTVVVLTMTGLVGNIIKYKDLDSEQLVITLVSIGAAFVVSGIVYDICKNKPLKYILAIASISALVYNLFVGLDINGYINTIINILLVSVMIPSIAPGIDFFKTGDDSTWEKIVRNIFTIAQPISIIAVVAIYAYKVL